jgi:hypothetical protein
MPVEISAGIFYVQVFGSGLLNSWTCPRPGAISGLLLEKTYNDENRGCNPLQKLLSFYIINRIFTLETFRQTSREDSDEVSAIYQ